MTLLLDQEISDILRLNHIYSVSKYKSVLATLKIFTKKCDTGADLALENHISGGAQWKQWESNWRYLDIWGNPEGKIVVKKTYIVQN